MKGQGIDPEKEDPALSKKYNFHLIPDGKNNYRSGQITQKDLPNIIKKYKIKNIIRLNGNNADSRMSASLPYFNIDQEQKICQDNNCNFYMISPHEGYIKGKGYDKSANVISDIMKKGNTLIHCLWGADRTGGMVGGYLKRINYFTDDKDNWMYTTKYNNWVGMIKRKTFFGSGYDKYADTFIPIEKIKTLYK